MEKIQFLIIPHHRQNSIKFLFNFYSQSISSIFQNKKKHTKLTPKSNFNLKTNFVEVQKPQKNLFNKNET